MCVTSFELYKCNFSFSPKVVQFGIETKFSLDRIALHFCYWLRLCCNWKPVFSWWSLPLLLWPQCVVQRWYCREKLDASHSWNLKVKSNYYISRFSLSCSQCSSESEGAINSCEKIWAKHLESEVIIMEIIYSTNIFSRFTGTAWKLYLPLLNTVIFSSYSDNIITLYGNTLCQVLWS